MLNAHDEDFNVVFWNCESELVTGYSAAEIMNHPHYLERLYPDPAYRRTTVDQWFSRGGVYRNWGRGVTCRDGTVKVVSWSNNSPQAPVPGWATWSIGIDITERKRAEERLRESEAMARAVQNATTEAIILIDP